MRNNIAILILLLFTACHNAKKEVSWLNKQAFVNYATTSFQLGGQDLNDILAVYVYTGLQATQLDLERVDDIIHARIPKGEILFSGPARLVIEFENEKLNIYPFRGKQTVKTEEKDFRSPKTLITDSSLTQQQLVYTVNAARNIILQNNKAASEVWFDLSPQEKTYQAQENKAETSYYVQAGSVKNIRLSRTNNVNGKASFQTNLLQDAYGNTIADGTKAIFYIKKNKEITRIERVSKDGQVNLALPTYIRGPYAIWLEIGLATSNKIVMR